MMSSQFSPVTSQRSTASEPVLQRLAACVEYDGSSFHGWQRLKSGLPTVQAAVEQALGKVADHPVHVVCAGRTDAGVHGSGQIIHFDSSARRSERGWAFGTNTHLPDTVALRWVKPVPDSFHARFSAESRRYRYIIYNHAIRPAHLHRGLTWNHSPLDVSLMQTAANFMVGEHDFTSLRAVQCQAKNPVRTVHHLSVQRFGALIILDIQANAFLHHMVRNVAGVLMAIGAGKRAASWVPDVLAKRDRRAAGVTAPPWGLYFVKANYPAFFDVPEESIGPAFIAPLTGPP